MQCAWLRCPLFEAGDVVVGREPLYCAQCRMASISEPVSFAALTVFLGPILQSPLSTNVSTDDAVILGLIQRIILGIGLKGCTSKIVGGVQTKISVRTSLPLSIENIDLPLDEL